MRVVVRLTEAEYAAVAARSVEIGHTVPSYLALTGLRPEGVAWADARSAVTNLVGTRRVLAGVANNLNQLAAKLHSTGEADAALPAVIEAVGRLSDRVEDAVTEVTSVLGGAVKRR